MIDTLWVQIHPLREDLWYSHWCSPNNLSTSFEGLICRNCKKEVPKSIRMMARLWKAKI